MYHSDNLSLEFIVQTYREHGDRMYSGEPVTQLQHAWQCGQLALQAGASDALQLASWLHDIGHLWRGLPGTPTLAGLDDQHEVLAAHRLAPLFGSAVSEPIRWHVDAKRFLVATQPNYLAQLSVDSVRSLALQGGPMLADECQAFISKPFHQDAIRLRVWDDSGKRANHFAASKQIALQQLTDLIDRVAQSAVS